MDNKELIQHLLNFDEDEGVDTSTGFNAIGGHSSIFTEHTINEVFKALVETSYNSGYYEYVEGCTVHAYTDDDVKNNVLIYTTVDDNFLSACRKVYSHTKGLIDCDAFVKYGFDKYDFFLCKEEYVQDRTGEYPNNGIFVDLYFQGHIENIYKTVRHIYRTKTISYASIIVLCDRNTPINIEPDEICPHHNVSDYEEWFQPSDIMTYIFSGSDRDILVNIHQKNTSGSYTVFIVVGDGTNKNITINMSSVDEWGLWPSYYVADGLYPELPNKNTDYSKIPTHPDVRWYLSYGPGVLYNDCKTPITIINGLLLSLESDGQIECISTEIKNGPMKGIKSITPASISKKINRGLTKPSQIYLNIPNNG